MIKSSRVSLLFLSVLLAGCQGSLPLDSILPPVVPITSLPATETKPQTAPSLGYLLLKDGKHSEAERWLKNRLESHPDDDRARTNLGILFVEMQQPERALAELQLVVTESSAFCPAQVQIAQIHMQRFDISAAEQAYQRCIGQQPGYGAALLNLGILYELYRGELDRAVVLYERYQRASIEPEPSVANWITDLNRRLASETPANQIAEVTP